MNKTQTPLKNPNQATHMLINLPHDTDSYIIYCTVTGYQLSW